MQSRAEQLKSLVEEDNKDIVMDLDMYEEFCEAYPDIAATPEGERFLLEVLRSQGFDV